MCVDLTKELMRNANHAVRIDKWKMVDCCKGRVVSWTQGVSWEFRIHDWGQEIMTGFIRNWMRKSGGDENYCLFEQKEVAGKRFGVSGNSISTPLAIATLFVMMKQKNCPMVTDTSDPPMLSFRVSNIDDFRGGGGCSLIQVDGASSSINAAEGLEFVSLII